MAADTNALADHPLLASGHLPRFRDVDPASIPEAIEYLLGELTAELEAIESGVAPTWEALVEPLERMGDRLVPRPLFDFEDGPGEWTRSTNAPESPARVDGAAGPDGGRCVRIVVDDLSGWDTFGRELPPGSIPPEHALLTFKARGESDTTQLAVELRERDGSRWIGVVTLGAEWSSYALPAGAFALWDPRYFEYARTLLAKGIVDVAQVTLGQLGDLCVALDGRVDRV